MRKLNFFLALLVTLSPIALSQEVPLNLMPVPDKVTRGSGFLLIPPAFQVGVTGNTEVRLQHAVEIFLDELRRRTGMLPVDVSLTDVSKATLIIRTEGISKEVQELGEDESYTLNVTSAGAKLQAATTLGAIRGLQTFLQLLTMTSAGFAVPAVTINDQPRFPWRGLMIDVSRHFIPIDVLKRNLDAMAAVKMNVFHWHLSDDQGFRIESKRFPNLQQMGSDGLYYTQDEVRDLIAYARDRGIRVVPEFDMPGHCTSWLVGYPELASRPGSYSIERNWGIFDPALDPTQERTYRFLDEFIGEMAKLFPDEFFHIGGDEVNGKQWDANPKIQDYMRAHGIKNNQELQAYFNRRVQDLVRRHGKVMLGWDEILQPDLPKNVVIQSWRGQASVAQATRQGYRGLLSYGFYLDLMWPASRHYAVDPLGDGASDLNVTERERILGGEACMWSEFVSPENIDSRIWPRAAAIAERLWSPASVQDVNSMYERLEVIRHQLDWLGLTHDSEYPLMLRRIAGMNDVPALRVLADVVEPVKDYAREELALTPPTSGTPLNRLVDAVHPESNTAREFNEMVDVFLSNRATEETQAQMAYLLGIWRENRAKLQPFEKGSSLLTEVVPLSQNLSALGTAGLQAMDYISSGKPAPEEWSKDSLALVQAAEKPQAQLLLMVAPPIEKLVRAAAKAAVPSQ
ncbi:MAG TPA: family 20 glycosylhydrolase [Terriglobales bacterium]|nr:family 20 glycosylhydrolase [Terriglobales bacterium]